jgi:hypothetical protein
VILPGKFCYRSHLLTSLKQDFRRWRLLKTKHRNRVVVWASLPVALSNIVPRFDKLCSRKRA